MTESLQFPSLGNFSLKDQQKLKLKPREIIKALE